MTPDDIHNLVPAFMGAALVILVVAAGVLVFVWRQYPPPVRPERAGELLIDPERSLVKHGLRMSGVVVLALGLTWLCAAVLFGQAATFGPASFLLPAAVAVDGLLFLTASQLFSAKA